MSACCIEPRDSRNSSAVARILHYPLEIDVRITVKSERIGEVIHSRSRDSLEFLLVLLYLVTKHIFVTELCQINVIARMAADCKALLDKFSNSLNTNATRRLEIALQIVPQEVGLLCFPSPDKTRRNKERCIHSEIP